MNPCFKTDNPTGRYRSFFHAYVEIRNGRGGKSVGSISYMGSKRAYGIMLHVKDSQECGWKNITLAKSFDKFNDTENIKDAKEFVKANWKAIEAKYQIVEI